MRQWKVLTVIKVLPCYKQRAGWSLRFRSMANLPLSYFFLLSCSLSVSMLKAAPPVAEFRTPELLAAEKAIYEGRLTEAGRGLSKVRLEGLQPVVGLWHALLSARLMHDNGNPTGAMAALEKLDPMMAHRPEFDELRAEAYLEKARMLRSLFWFDAFNRMNDTAGMIIRHSGLPDHLKSRFHLNRVMYLSMVLLHFKAGPDLDSMNALLSAAPADQRFLYKPELALAVQINYGRNLDRTIINKIRDSLWSKIDKQEPQDGAYDRISMWRAVANMYLDETISDRITERQRTIMGDRALICFDRALGIQGKHFPKSRVDRVTLLDLKSLVLNRMKRHVQSLEVLRTAEDLLQAPAYQDPGYYYLHFMTANYRMQVMDSALSGRLLYQEMMHAKDRWQWLERHWDAWQKKNVDSLGHYRFHYTMDPGATLAMLCYRMYQVVPDSSLLDQAFAAQERSKYREMRRHWKSHFGISEPVIPALSTLRKQLSVDDALISATDAGVYETSTYMLVITRDTVAFIQLYNSRATITRTDILGEPSALFKDLQSFKRALHETWQLVFKEAEPIIRNRNRLTVWPSGYLSGFNLELLVPDTTGVDRFGKLQMMRDRHRFHYDYSWMIGQMRKQLPGISTAERKIFVPDYTGTSLYRLRFFDQLATDLSTRFGFRVFKGREASVARFMKEAPTAGILQIAGHGYSDRLIPGEQYVYMDSTSVLGGNRLFPIHLTNIDMRAALAVLSICMGGIAEWSHQNPRNLAYWFSQSGVHTCIYSYWKLDDRSTARVLDRFYTYLEQGVWRYEALRLAQNDVRNEARTDEEKNPIYWAGLTIIGEDGPIEKLQRQRISGSYVFLFIIFLTILELIFFFRSVVK